ncbi:hypothetical protein ACQJBY_032158 [Aegilops geniculata]
MAMNPLSQEHPNAWPWGVAMYTNLHYQQYHYEKEHLFEKALTPSDVGKLNRLVIPKQHAERCFPLGGDSGEKGLLLSFDDEAGKPWRFRYSYWTSSQSYVLTKGWSRRIPVGRRHQELQPSLSTDTPAQAIRREPRLRARARGRSRARDAGDVWLRAPEPLRRRVSSSQQLGQFMKKMTRRSDAMPFFA